MRRLGSRSMRTAGALSSHSQSLTHLRRMDLTNASTRLTVALLHPPASLASVIASIKARLMVSSSLPPRCGSSHLSLARSSLAVALCDCSFNHLTAASFQVRRGLSPSLAMRHSSDLIRSWNSCARALLAVPEVLAYSLPVGSDDVDPPDTAAFAE